MGEVVVDAREARVVAAVPEQLLPHADEGRRAAGGQVEAAEQLLARRLDGAQQRPEAGRGGGVPVVGGPGGAEPGRVGPEVAGEQAEEVEPGRDRQGGVAVEHPAGEGHAGGLAAAGEQGAAEALEGLRGLGDVAAPGTEASRPSTIWRSGERSIRARPRSAMLPRSSWKKLTFIARTHLVGRPPPARRREPSGAGALAAT